MVTTAQSHHRIMVVEVMDHSAGWIALHSGTAGGSDIILIPEIPYDIANISEVVTRRNKKGKRFSIIVVAEGAKPKGGEFVIKRLVKESQDPVRLGGIGFMLGEQIERLTGLETRTVVMGHLLRGGTPTAYDRTLATLFGNEAVDMIRDGSFGCMVGMNKGSVTRIPLKRVTGGPRTIPIEYPLLNASRAVGTYFGNEKI